MGKGPPPAHQIDAGIALFRARRVRKGAPAFQEGIAAPARRPGGSHATGAGLLQTRQVRRCRQGEQGGAVHGADSPSWSTACTRSHAKTPSAPTWRGTPPLRPRASPTCSSGRATQVPRHRFGSGGTATRWRDWARIWSLTRTIPASGRSCTRS